MLYAALRPLIFALPPEVAHRLTIRVMGTWITPAATAPDPVLATTVAGLDFPSPLGLAAGFDKDAEVPDAVLRLGFGFAEVGTITPVPQPGNPRPRMFRLVEDRAVINRLGFNNGGLEAALERLKSRKRAGIVGVNVGANKDAADRIADYAKGVAAVLPVADYVTVNISSPNTPGLRALQSKAALGELVDAVLAARKTSGVPLFLKVAPDLEPAEIEDIAEVATKLDGLIVSNTTVTREGLASRWKAEGGGLSGAPLLERSTEVLRRFSAVLQGKLPLIGAGGVASGEDAYQKILAGASLVQLYTGMVYEGPGLPGRINRKLAELLRRDGFRSVGEAVGKRQ
jgi:dihydroorotate dehydrogenase